MLERAQAMDTDGLNAWLRMRYAAHMTSAWHRWRDLAAGHRLPAAFVDLDALERNVDRTLARIARPDVSLRVASKSVRHVGLLRRVLARGGDRCRGLMCYAADEAVALAERGFDDLLVAYPTLQPGPLAALAGCVADGTTASVVVDATEQVDALAAAGRAAGTAMTAIIEVDMSWRPVGGRVHLGVRRSPIRSVAAALGLARHIRQSDGVTLGGVMGYEAQIAGLPDQVPGARAESAMRRLLKRRSQPLADALRGAVVDALRADGHDVRLVNAGGTGNLHLASRDPCVTEVTAGSAFVAPHLFDGYRDLDLEPAACFALEVVRRPDAGIVTCGGGGCVASGPPAPDRLPQPWLPPGLRYLPHEGAGEVQTPLAGAPPDLAPGDPVFFRHAKAGELAERFATYVLVRGSTVESVEPTYRGEGLTFM